MAVSEKVKATEQKWNSKKEELKKITDLIEMGDTVTKGELRGRAAACIVRSLTNIIVVAH